MRRYSKKVTYEGIKFDSLVECQYYKLLKARKDITNLQVHKPIILQEGFVCEGQRVQKMTYEVDFYYEQGGQVHLVDVKGSDFMEEVFKLKWKMTKNLHREWHFHIMVFNKKDGRWYDIDKAPEKKLYKLNK